MKPSRRKILVTGTNVVKRVDAESALCMQKRGVDLVFYTPDGIFGLENHMLRSVITPQGTLNRIRGFISLLQEVHPDHVEMYIDNPYKFLPFYSIISRLMGYKLIIWSRGELYNFEMKNIYRRLVIRFCFSLANYFLAKEAYVVSRIRDYKLASPEKVFWLPNKIPVRTLTNLVRKKPIILFLNSPKKFRNTMFLGEVIPMVAEVIPDVQFLYVGPRFKEEMEYVRDIMRNSNALPWTEILPFAQDTQRYYEEAALFVLPADLVYVNHSLLEAMERGVPPLVADIDPKVTEIIDHNINGLVLALDSKVWARAIIDLLRNEPRRRQLGAMAHEKIAQSFNLDDKINELMEFYERRIWTT